MSISDWLGAFSLLCAAFAAWKAEQAVRQARLARNEDAQVQAEARMDRQWQQLDRIGSLIEDIFWNAAPDRTNVAFSEDHWKAARNRVRQLLAGSEYTLPHCQSLVQASGRELAYARASLARSEVEIAMRETVAHMKGFAGLAGDAEP